MREGDPTNVLLGESSDGASEWISRRSRNNWLRPFSGATCGDVASSIDGDIDLLTAGGDEISSIRGCRCVALCNVNELQRMNKSRKMITYITS